MAWTSTDVTALEAAIKIGARQVRHSDGRMVTYHSLDEMMRLLEAMKNGVASTGGTARTRCTLATFSKD